MEAREIGDEVATAVERLNAEVPTNLREAENARVAQFRPTCDMLGATVLAARDASWTVAGWGEGQGMEGGGRKVACSARVAHIVAMPSPSAVLHALRPMGKFFCRVLRWRWTKRRRSNWLKR